MTKSRLGLKCLIVLVAILSHTASASSCIGDNFGLQLHGRKAVLVIDQKNAHQIDWAAIQRMPPSPTRTSVEVEVASSERSRVFFGGDVEFDGKLADLELGTNGTPVFVRFTGPGAFREKSVESSPEQPHVRTLAGQDEVRHPAGYSSPLGPFTARVGNRSIDSSKLNAETLEALAQKRTQVQFTYSSGIQVEGTLTGAVLHSESKKPIVLTLNDCTVRRGDKILYKKEWGPFDLLLSDRIEGLSLRDPAEIWTDPQCWRNFRVS